jgi:hypothetical protein
MTNPLRQRAGIPAGGEFASYNRTESAVHLGPTESIQDIEDWIARNRLTLDLSGVTLMAAELNALPKITDLARTDAFRNAYLAVNGYREEERSAYDTVLTLLADSDNSDLARKLDSFVSSFLTRTGTPAQHDAGAIPSEPDFDIDPGSSQVLSDFVQGGGIADKVQSEDGTIFHRLRDGVSADSPEFIRVQANRPLTDNDMERLSSLTAYAYASTVRSRNPLSAPYRDSPYSFVVRAESDNASYARMSRFEQDLPTLISDGSRLRTTDQAGPGTAGTQAISGFGELGLSFELYYDRVG